MARHGLLVIGLSTVMSLQVSDAANAKEPNPPNPQTVIYNNQCYLISANKTRFDHSQTLLEQQPWWDNQSFIQGSNNDGFGSEVQSQTTVPKGWGNYAIQFKNNLNHKVDVLNAYGYNPGSSSKEKVGHFDVGIRHWYITSELCPSPSPSPSPTPTPTPSPYIPDPFVRKPCSYDAIKNNWQNCSGPQPPNPPGPPQPPQPAPTVVTAISEATPETRGRLMRCHNSGRSDCQFGPLIQSTLMPGNVTASGGLVTQGYVNSLADTILERLPSRQIQRTIQEENVQIIEGEIDNNKPVRGLWKTTPRKNESAELAELKPDNASFTEPAKLTEIYTEPIGSRAWVRGFGGSVTPFRTGGLYNSRLNYTFEDVYTNFYSIHSGLVVGVDTSLRKDLQIGAFINNGFIDLQEFSGVYSGGGSWTPTGWGGGVMASYWKPNFYVQGLFGATAFNGTHTRRVNIPGVFTTNYNAEKSTTSYVGAIRIGTPMQSGRLIWEPQLTATWNGNQDASYRETSGAEVKAFGLKVNSYSDNFLQTLLGIKLAWPIKQGRRAMWTPNLRVAWLADWDTNNGSVSFQRAYDRSSNPAQAEIPSNQQTEHGVMVEAGLDYSLFQGPTSSWKLYAKGGANLWSSKAAEWRTSGGITFQF